MRIARAAEVAEDVIETHVVYQIRSGRTRSRTRSCCFLLDVQKVIEDIDYMRRKAINVKARSGMETELEQRSYSAATSSTSAATSSTPLTSNQPSMVGFDDVLLLLLHKLTRLPSSRQVIPIVGMGELYSVERILAELVSGLSIFTRKTVESTTGTVDEALVGFHKSLYRRRYLIILDDMWSINAWDDMNLFFPDTDNGSRIVVTTRHSDVANYLSISQLNMRCLNKDNSWDLFCQKSFGKQGCCPPELVEIGKKIVEKCRGLPLSIVVVGGHLKKSSLMKESWENVARLHPKFIPYLNTIIKGKTKHRP